jgi:DNA-binding NarL/FixJ family response regulator
MLNQPVATILLADEDPGVRKSLGLVLTWAGYRVCTASHTIDGILLLHTVVPDVIIFNLDLAPVPGYDFLAMVRHRLPQVAVIATSIVGEDGIIPEGVLADAMYVKGASSTETMLDIIAELLQTRASRRMEHIENDPYPQIEQVRIVGRAV